MSNQIESLTSITDTIYEKDELSKLLANQVKDLEASLKNLNDEIENQNAQHHQTGHHTQASHNQATPLVTYPAAPPPTKCTA